MDVEEGVPMVSVAPHDADPDVKAAAQYVCDGVADEVELRHAAQAMASVGGGVVKLEKGTFIQTKGSF